MSKKLSTGLKQFWVRSFRRHPMRMYYVMASSSVNWLIRLRRDPWIKFKRVAAVSNWWKTFKGALSNKNSIFKTIITQFVNIKKKRFQAALKKYGVPEEEIFQTADLYERRNIPQVTLCLFALSRLVKKNFKNYFKKFKLILIEFKIDPETSGIQWTSSWT